MCKYTKKNSDPVSSLLWPSKGALSILQKNGLQYSPFRFVCNTWEAGSVRVMGLVSHSCFCPSFALLDGINKLQFLGHFAGNYPLVRQTIPWAFFSMVSFIIISWRWKKCSADKEKKCWKILIAKWSSFYVSECLSNPRLFQPSPVGFMSRQGWLWTRSNEQESHHEQTK